MDRATESANRTAEKAGEWDCNEIREERESDDEGMKEGGRETSTSQICLHKGKGEALGQRWLGTKRSEVGGAQIEDKLWHGWRQNFVEWGMREPEEG